MAFYDQNDDGLPAQKKKGKTMGDRTWGEALNDVGSEESVPEPSATPTVPSESSLAPEPLAPVSLPPRTERLKPSPRKPEPIPVPVVLTDFEEIDLVKVLETNSSPPPPPPRAQEEILEFARHGGTLPLRAVVTFYRSLATMLTAGIPLFAVFEFLSREPEHPVIGQTCRRIAQALTSGQPLHAAAAAESQLFDRTAVRMLEVGYKSGQLSVVLDRLASDKEKEWQLVNQLKSQLTYPLGIAAVTFIAVVLLPPLVLGDLLTQVVSLTDEPPALTLLLLAFSRALSSPPILLGVPIVLAVLLWLWKQPAMKSFLESSEYKIWKVPALGRLWQDVVAQRFLRIFAMTYECGLPATQCLTLSAAATGSTRVRETGDVMKKTLIEGGTLTDSIRGGDFLPEIALESIEAGQLTGTIPAMMESVANILATELNSRVESVSKMVEPIVLAGLGLFVGVFALGCLLPIIKLTESL